MHSEGSVVAVGQKEVDWMARHWVSLKEAHFYPKNIPPKECFELAGKIAWFEDTYYR